MPNLKPNRAATFSSLPALQRDSKGQTAQTTATSGVASRSEIPGLSTLARQTRVAKAPKSETGQTRAVRPSVTVNEALLASIIEARLSPPGKGRPVQGIPGNFGDSDKRSLTLLDLRTGRCYTAGHLQTYSQQSLSKPLAENLAIKLIGLRNFKQQVGFEASGRPYNSDATLLGKSHVPYNGNVNIGALKVWDIILSTTPSGTDPFDTYLAHVRSLANNPELQCNEAMAQGEFDFKPEGGVSNNRKLLQKLRDEGALANDPESVLKAYCRACAIMINTRDSARIASAFHDGVDPLTGKVHMSREVAEIATRSMTVSGLYDQSGQYFVTAGFQGKTGVDGGVMGKLSGHPGIIVATHHADLNSQGNSGESLKWIRTLSGMNLVFEKELATNPVRRGLGRLAASLRSNKGTPALPQLPTSPRELDKSLQSQLTDEGRQLLRDRLAQLEREMPESERKQGLFYLKPMTDEASLAKGRVLMSAADKSGRRQDYIFVLDSHFLHKIVVAPAGQHNLSGDD